MTIELKNVPADSQDGVISITEIASGPCHTPATRYCVGWPMENPSLVLVISKLAVAGEQAGFTLEQMIGLDAGLEVTTLMDLISWRLHGVPLPPVICNATCTSTRARLAN
jgi:hypothetical protein